MYLSQIVNPTQENGKWKSEKASFMKCYFMKSLAVKLRFKFAQNLSRDVETLLECLLKDILDI